MDIFSFDKKDCKQYDLCYNNQPYPFLENLRLIKNKIEYDCYFCGYDKERLFDLIRIKDALKNSRCTFRFRIIFEKHKKCNLDKDALKDIEVMKRPIVYNEILEDTSKAKCIIEILKKGQWGFTLRTMESLFLDKKLITNYSDIKNYDFYNPNNIFILDNNYDKIKEFLAIPYEPVPEYIKERYYFNTWIENFFKK